VDLSATLNIGGGSSGASGSGAGALARRQRRTEELDRAMVEDARAWDFFQAQVQDWESRRVSWEAFTRRVAGTGGKKNGSRRMRGMWSIYGRFG